MERPVEEVLAALKRHFGVETDADLARKLRVDKSTISSWKARGSIPARYQGILEGSSSSTVGVSPIKWSEHEKAAFDLALFRFSRIMTEKANLSDYVESLTYFSGLAAPDICILQDFCQRDLAAYEQPLHTALSTAIYEDLADPQASLERDIQRLITSGAFSTSPEWRLPK